MNKILNRPLVKNVLSVLAVPIFGFILLNLTFIADFLFQGAINAIVRPFAQVDYGMTWRWFPPVKHVLFMIAVGIVSWFVLRSKLRTIYKAIYSVVPMAVVLVTLGIAFYRWPVVTFLLGGLFSGGCLYYCYRTKQPWIYYYAVILISLVLGIFTLAGGEI